MLNIAIIFQIAAIFLAIFHFVTKESSTTTSGAESVEVKPGQVYEELYKGNQNEPSSIFLVTVLDVKDGYAKYRLQGYSLNPGGELVKPIADFKRLRLIKPTTNPFAEPTSNQ